MNTLLTATRLSPLGTLHLVFDHDEALHALDFDDYVDRLDALLRRYDADRLLIGHTIFPDISTFHDGRVIAVNVQNERNRKKNRGRAVLIEGSRISVVGNRGVKRVLEE